MSNLAVRVEGIGKRYRIGAQQERYYTFRDALYHIVKAPIERLGQLSGRKMSQRDSFWALRDVTFDIEKGEAIGIIGLNGAGKSTLLKILSRITAPTEGRIEVYGRVGSLLEVGTGFHPELTGRENVYFNGSVLGMKKTEIESKFDEIVSFAGVERFLDTPVKRYSSGMWVRLAFAVAAHLEPEILVVDEVLAVGDSAFQKKCLGKMRDVTSVGRTVLLVSHNMAVVNRVCSKVIWLASGRIREIGPPTDTIAHYLSDTPQHKGISQIRQMIAALPPDPAFRLLDVRIRQGGVETTTVVNGQPTLIEIAYEVFERTRGLRVLFDVCDEDFNILIRSFHDDDADVIPTTEPGRYVSVAEIPPDLLAPREYTLRIHGTIFNVRMCTGPGLTIPLSVERTSTVNRAYMHEEIRSKLQVRLAWKTRPLEDDDSPSPSVLQESSPTVDRPE